MVLFLHCFHMSEDIRNSFTNNLTNFQQLFSNLEFTIMDVTRVVSYRVSERCNQHIQAAQEIIGNPHKTPKAWNIFHTVITNLISKNLRFLHSAQPFSKICRSKNPFCNSDIFLPLDPFIITHRDGVHCFFLLCKPAYTDSMNWKPLLPPSFFLGI